MRTIFPFPCGTLGQITGASGKGENEMNFKKGLILLLALGLLFALCACSGAGSSAGASPSPQAADEQPRYEYQLKAGETMEVYDTVFDKTVTVILDPASTRDGSIDLRSNIYFDNCVFNAGLSILGDYHAMVSLGEGCSLGEGSLVTCKELNSGVAKETTLDDNYVKVFVGCEGVSVETEAAFGVVTGGFDFVFNGTAYSKAELAPDADYLGVYSLYEGDSMTYVKLAIGDDDSVEVLP